MASPSIYSRCSTARQSEISFGILDYYTRDPSPLHIPDLLPPNPKVDPAMEQFNFELVPQTPTSSEMKGVTSLKHAATETKAGAERVQLPFGVLPPSSRSPPQTQHQKTYSLFPATKETPRCVKATEVRLSPQSPAGQACEPAGNVTSVPSHQQPDPSYRPRKESLSSSIRSRKDSFTSFRSKRVPLRIISSSSTTSAGMANSTISSASPPERSRWSDDTITSPTAVTTPGPRMSFGSMLGGRDSAQYPACFFEDDDEEAPLRRKFAWKRSTSLIHERQTKSNGRFNDQPSLAWRLKCIMLCGGCGSARRVAEPF